ncbi:hypothetical protein PCE1_004166 [Barthelona sp. PCE]
MPRPITTVVASCGNEIAISDDQIQYLSCNSHKIFHLSFCNEIDSSNLSGDEASGLIKCLYSKNLFYSVLVTEYVVSVKFFELSDNTFIYKHTSTIDRSQFQSADTFICLNEQWCVVKTEKCDDLTIVDLCSKEIKEFEGRRLRFSKGIVLCSSEMDFEAVLINNCNICFKSLPNILQHKEPTVVLSQHPTLYFDINDNDEGVLLTYGDEVVLTNECLPDKVCLHNSIYFTDYMMYVFTCMDTCLRYDYPHFTSRYEDASTQGINNFFVYENELFGFLNGFFKVKFEEKTNNIIIHKDSKIKIPQIDVSSAACFSSDSNIFLVDVLTEKPSLLFWSKDDDSKNTVHDIGRCFSKNNIHVMQLYWVIETPTSFQLFFDNEIVCERSRNELQSSNFRIFGSRQHIYILGNDFVSNGIFTLQFSDMDDLFNQPYFLEVTDFIVWVSTTCGIFALNVNTVDGTLETHSSFIVDVDDIPHANGNHFNPSTAVMQCDGEISILKYNIVNNCLSTMYVCPVGRAIFLDENVLLVNDALYRFTEASVEKIPINLPHICGEPDRVLSCNQPRQLHVMQPVLDGFDIVVDVITFNEDFLSYTMSQTRFNLVFLMEANKIINFKNICLYDALIT